MVGFKHYENKRLQSFESSWARMDQTVSPIIKNFHTFYFHGSYVQVKDSCGPDAIFHCLCSIYDAEPGVFSRSSLWQSSKMLALIKAYIGRNEEEVYEHRIKLLIGSGFKISFDKEAVINANSNIDSSIRMLCLPYLPSAKVTRICKCGLRDHDLATIEVNMIKLIENGIQRLDTCMDCLELSKTRPKCKDCKGQVNSIVTYSPLIFIGIEPIITNENQYSLPDLKITELPQHINFNSNIYNLQAAIQYKRDIKHYTAHCLKNGTFLEFDDLNHETKPSTTNNIGIHFLIFTINSDQSIN